jgi:hypothetical protein
MSDLKKCLLAAIIAAAPCGFAGTIITTNLPSNDIIVDINAMQDGAATFSGPNQNLWYQPFDLGGNLLEVTLQPGTYSFRAIDEADAASMFPSLTGGQLAEIGGGAWTFNSPWSTDYMVFDSSARTNANESQLFSGSINQLGATFGNAAAAYAAAISGGYYDQIVTNGGRYTGTIVNQFTITGSPETLIFVIPDYDLSDNNGIESVLISGSPSSSSAPEPATWLLLGAGGSAMFIFSRVRTRRP